jgi:hypothetical protein
MVRDDMAREDMALRLLRAVTCVLLLLVAGTPARAQEKDGAPDEAVQRVYAMIERRIHAEFDFQMRGVAQQMLNPGGPASKTEFFQKRVRLLAYNRATLVAYCVAEAEHDRPPTAAPVPWQNNLLLTTCVDEKVGQLQKFSQLAAYADFFFPERIEECGDRVRLPERERVLQPYAFLLVEQPKLYDFARYNECLMSSSPASPAAR